MVLLIVIMVSLHAVGAISLFKTGFGAFSLNNPIFYVPMGGLVVVAIPVQSSRHVSGFLHRKGK